MAIRQPLSIALDALDLFKGKGNLTCSTLVVTYLLHGVFGFNISLFAKKLLFLQIHKKQALFSAVTFIFLQSQCIGVSWERFEIDSLSIGESDRLYCQAKCLLLKSKTATQRICLVTIGCRFRQVCH